MADNDAGFCDIEDLAERFKSGMIDHSISDDEVEFTRRSLVQWYHRERRALPWRGDSFEAVKASRSRSAGAGAGGATAKAEDSASFAAAALAIVTASAEPDADADADAGAEAETEAAAVVDIDVGTGAATDAPEKDIFVTPPPSAYGTWVSEIMLQQTRVETVIPYWYRWMRRYPTIRALASASPDEVNASWAGLGYYRRARQLHAGAQQLVAEAPEGQEPALSSTADGLRKVPGIGAYTAGAISSIALGLVEPLVDGNVHRVFSRLRMLRCELGSKDMETRSWALARRLVDDKEPGAFNQGLMELGATVCKPISPRCGECPLRAVCQARQLLQGHGGRARQGLGLGLGLGRDSRGAEAEKESGLGLGADGLPADMSFFPVRAPKKRPREVLLSVGVFCRVLPGGEDTACRGASAEGVEGGSATATGREQYLLVKRKDSGLLQGQWEFPNTLLWEEAPSRGGKAAGKTNEVKDGKSRSKSKSKSASTDKAQTDTVADGNGSAPLFASREDVPEGDFEQAAAMRALLQHSYGCLWQETLNGDASGDVDVKAVQYILAPLEVIDIKAEAWAPAAAAIEPIVHVFSHQRHTMHVTETRVCCKEVEGAPGHDGLELRWMSAEELCSVGVTSGCKKVLAAVQKRSHAKTKPMPTPFSATKRKAATVPSEGAAVKSPTKRAKAAKAVAAVATPSISMFFAKK